MIDLSFYGDIQDRVKKKCKQLYKKNFFDRSWRKEYDEVMTRGITEIYKFLE